MKQNKIVFLFCGVESAGKSTSVELANKYLKEKGLNVKVVGEVGRDISVGSGGVDSMSLFDYEHILFSHQANFLSAYGSDCQVILLDTDSIYTRYYLEKDETLLSSNKELSHNLIQLAGDIVKLNLKNSRITKLIYLNSDCPFVQDGTRTYEKTRKQDDSILLNLYKKSYDDKLISIVDGKDFALRYEKIKEIINETLAKETDR